jgi:hypothetical protein
MGGVRKYQQRRLAAFWLEARFYQPAHCAIKLFGLQSTGQMHYNFCVDKLQKCESPSCPAIYCGISLKVRRVRITPRKSLLSTILKIKDEKQLGQP